MVRKVSSPNKLKSDTRLKKANKRMAGVDTKTKEKINKPVKLKKVASLDDCNLDDLILE